MSNIEVSIIISSYNRLPLMRRTLWSIASRGPSVPFEVIVIDDGSDENILGELQLYSAQFYWKFIKFNREKFEEVVGLKKFLNNPCCTNNIGFRHSAGKAIFQQGNEVLPWYHPNPLLAKVNVYDQLLSEMSTDTPHSMVMSTTYDVPREILDRLDQYGTNLNNEMVEYCYRWPLQSKHYRSDVTNYISLASRELWEKLHGYDERYYGGISAEDSDFVRRARALPDFKMVVSDAISLHQTHGGKTCYANPSPNVITQQRWDAGVSINHAVYGDWDGTHENRQGWDWGTLGVEEVISNG